MAEDKIIITEIDVDVSKSIKDIQTLRESVASLKQTAESFKNTEKENTAEHIQAQIAYKAESNELRNQENLMIKLTTAQKDGVGTIKKLEAENAKLRKEQEGLNLTTKEGLARNNEINKILDKNTSFIKDNSDAYKKSKMNIGNYSESIQDAAGKISTVIPAAGEATKVIQILGVAFKAALGPIGLIIAILGALYAYFTRSEEGQNKLTKALAVFKSVLSTVMNIAEKAGKFLVEMFEKPKEALKALGELIKSQITNRLEALKGMGAAIIKIFSKDWKEGFKELGRNFVDFETGVKGTIGKVKGYFKDLSDEVSKNAAIAAHLADLQAALNKRIRAEMVEDAKLTMEVSDLRAKIAQKDKFTGEERLKMLDEVIAKENKMADDEVEIAKQKAFIHAENMKIGTRTKEDLDEQAKLEADIFNAETARNDKKRELERQRHTAILDNLADLQKVAEMAVNTFNAEVEAWKISNQSKLKIAQENNRLLTEQDIEAEKLRLETLAGLEEESLKKNLDLKIKEIDARENESEAAKNAEKLKLTDEYNNAVLSKEVEKQNALHELQITFDEQERQRAIDVATTNYDNLLALAENNLYAQIDIEKKQNELKRKEEIRSATKIGADVALINKKYDKAARLLDKSYIDSKLSLAAGSMDQLAQLAGEGTAVGKAAAVASTTIATYESAQKSYDALADIPYIGPVLGFAAAAIAVAAGIANVKKILSVKSGLPGDSSGGGSSISTSIPATSAPPAIVRSDVNPEVGAGIVSRSTGNQNGNKIELQPTLVEDDVTNKQKQTDTMKNTSML